MANIFNRIDNITLSHVCSIKSRCTASRLEKKSTLRKIICTFFISPDKAVENSVISSSETKFYSSRSSSCQYSKEIVFGDLSKLLKQNLYWPSSFTTCSKVPSEVSLGDTYIILPLGPIQRAITLLSPSPEIRKAPSIEWPFSTVNEKHLSGA